MCHMSAYKITLVIIVPKANNFHSHIFNMSTNTKKPYFKLYKCQHSSGTNMQYVSRYRDPLVILVPNASTLQLNMCHVSADTDTSYLCFCQMPALLIYTCVIC